MKIIYTDAARIALQGFYAAQLNRLEDEIKRKKFVFGDDQIEVTASDVNEAAQALDVLQKAENREGTFRNTLVLPRVYAIVGVLVTAGGIWYPSIAALYKSNVEQFLWIVSGIAMTLISIVSMFYFRTRDEYGKRLDMLIMEEMRMREFERDRKIKEESYKLLRRDD